MSLFSGFGFENEDTILWFIILFLLLFFNYNGNGCGCNECVEECECNECC